MTELSARLRAVASLVPKCETAADVGTDHGYLAAWLLENDVASRVFATDIHAGPLARAKQTAHERSFASRMDFFLSDGLQFPGADRAQTVVLAGMGGETMVSILSGAPWTRHGVTLVLQPQSKQPLLYAWLEDNGFSIDAARLCEDAGKLYLVLRAQGGEGAFTAPEALLLQSHDPLFPRYLAAERRRLLRALDGMRQASRDTAPAREALEARLQILKDYERETAKW